VFWWGNLKERDHLEGPGVGERIILRWIYTRWDMRVWTGGNEMSGSVKCGEFVDYL